MDSVLSLFILLCVTISSGGEGGEPFFSIKAGKGSLQEGGVCKAWIIAVV